MSTFFSFCGDALIPYSARTIHPVSTVEVKDATHRVGLSQTRLTGYKERELEDYLTVFSGEDLTVLDREWLGTATDFSRIGNIPCKPQWILMPLRDIGLQVGPRSADFIGTKGNHRYALGIERDLISVNLSDASVIDDIYTDIQECVSTLRRRDLIKASMIHTLQQCTSYLRYVMAQCIQCQKHDSQIAISHS